ncbi:MAG: DUF6529 family protein [bacterium]
MDPLTKSYITAGMVFLALFEFWSAMRIFGIKGEKPAHASLIMRLHRIGGYLFAVYIVWISWSCVVYMKELYATGNYSLDARGFTHGALAIFLFLVWGLKVGFVRRYKNFRPYVPLLGFILAIGTILLWSIAGWMYIIILGGWQSVL